MESTNYRIPMTDPISNIIGSNEFWCHQVHILILLKPLKRCIKSIFLKANKFEVVAIYNVHFNIQNIVQLFLSPYNFRISGTILFFIKEFCLAIFVLFNED